MRKAIWCLTWCCAYSNESNRYFPDVTVEDQQEIYKRYTRVISKENKKKGVFEDSMIDVAFARKMVRKINRENSILLIDFGGSSLKFAVVDIKQKKEADGLDFQFVVEKSFYFKDANKRCEENEKLYNFTWNDWASRKLKDFLVNMKNDEMQIPTSAALTFSSRVNQVAHNLAYFKLSDFKKDWWFKKEVESEQGIEVVAALNQSLKENEITLQVSCVLNDAIAAYMTGLSLEMKNPIGAIFGTGTNGGYTIPEFNGETRERLINPEWANADISNLSFIDDASKKFFSDNEKQLCQLEVLTAGLRLSEIIREKLLSKGLSDEETLSSLNNEKIYGIIDKEPGARSQVEEEIYRAVFEFKRRGYKIIAPIILAASGSNKEFSVVTNGTFAGKRFDQEILREVLEEAKSNIPETQDKKIIEIRFVSNASLYGAAYASLIFQPGILNE
ncbi:N-acetylglucosamine kinase 1 [Glugoides intestinalis]